jgi:hypothetical protein
LGFVGHVGDDTRDRELGPAQPERLPTADPSA